MQNADEYSPMPWAVTVSTSCCSTRDRAAAPAHTPIISASVWRKSWVFSSKKVSLFPLNRPTERTNPEVLTKSQQRWDGFVATAAAFKARGVCLCSVVAKVVQCFFYYVGVSLCDYKYNIINHILYIVCNIHWYILDRSCIYQLFLYYY